MSEERELAIWISDDADRVPLKTIAKSDFGDIEMTLVEYVPGTAARLRK